MMSLARFRSTLALLTERRAGLFITVDLFIIHAALLMALFGGGGSAKDFWYPIFVAPVLLLGVPILAESVAVERRSGTLDLALTSPGARFYFERRVMAVAVLMIAQGWLVVLLSRLWEPYPLAPPLIQVVTVCCFISAVALNWSLRLKTAGAVIFATYATAGAFGIWLFTNPIIPPRLNNGPMRPEQIIDWAQQNLVLAAASGIFYLYSLQRLARPESIIH